MLFYSYFTKAKLIPNMNYILDRVILALNCFLESLNNIVYLTIMQVLISHTKYVLYIKVLITQTSSRKHTLSKTKQKS